MKKFLFWKYVFGVGKIAEDQLQDYAQRKGVDLEYARKWLMPNLGE